MADLNRATVVADDNEEFDRLTLIRLGVWGLSSFLSLTLVVIAAQTDVGVKRATAAVTAITSPPRDPTTVTVTQMLARAAESDREARRLGEVVRSLSVERDRLATRVDSVEREVGDLTGSVTRSIAQQQQQAKVAPERTAAIAPAPVPVQSAPAPLPVQPAPIVSAPQTLPPAPTMQAVTPQAPNPVPNNTVYTVPTATVMSTGRLAAVAPASVDPKSARPLWPTSMPPPTVPSVDAAPAEIAGDPPAQNDQPEVIPLPRPSPLAALRAYGATATQADATNPQPQQPAADNTADPATTSSITKADTADATESTEQPKVEIGVDLGPGLSIALLRSRWEAFRKAQGASFVGIRPVVSIREINPKKPVELRLVVGPLAGIDVAVQLCQSLSGSQFPCQPAVFDGQRLVLR